LTTPLPRASIEAEDEAEKEGCPSSAFGLTEAKMTWIHDGEKDLKVCPLEVERPGQRGGGGDRPGQRAAAATVQRFFLTALCAEPSDFRAPLISMTVNSSLS